MFGSRKKKETIIIALGANFLKLGVFRQQGAKKELVNLVFRDIPGTSDADIAKAVTESIAGVKVKDANISIVVPAGVVITKNIDVPSTNPAEIKEITSLQAGRHTPYSREEIIADHIDIGVYKKNYTKILMVIVPSKIIKKQLDVLAKAGVKADKILFAPELTAWSIGKVLRLDTNSQPAALLVVDRDTCDFSVVHRSKLIFVRSIPLGAALLAKEPDKNNTRLCEEVKKSFEAYQAEDVEKAPKILYVCGAVDKLDTVTAMLEELTKVSVQKIPYMKNIAMSRPVIEFLSQDKGVSFFDIAASMQGCEDSKVNLIPEEVKLKLALLKRGRDMIRMGVLLLIGLMAGFFILVSNIYFKAAYVRVLDEKKAGLDAQTGALEQDFLKISLMREYFSQQGYALDVMAELIDLVNDAMELNEIRYDGKGILSVKGVSDSNSAVYSFVDSMSKSKYFKEVKTKYTTKRKEAGKDVVDFEVTSVLQKVKRGQ